MRDQVYTPELIAAAIGGDDSALSFLYNSTQEKVTQTVRSMIRDEDAVLDIVQDSFIKGFRSLDKLDDPKNYLAWMRRIATNTAVDYLKKKKPVLFSELAGEDGMEIEFEDENIGHMPDVLLDQKETSRLIQEIVSGLSDEQQLTIGLFYFEDMPIKSIAEKLGCSENTVKSRLSYGRKNIEKQVLELEKKGTKLYSLAPVPFFLWLLRSMHTEPSRNMLGTVLAECRRLASGVSATASQTTVQVGSQVAKKAAAGAAKKLATRIAAGILAAATVGGAAVAISNANEEPSTYRRPSHSETRGSEPTEEASTDATEPDTTPTVPEVDPTPAYQVILDEFTAACNDPDYLSHREQYPNTDIEAMVNYHTFGAFDLYYAYHDLDGNGVDELLIGDGSVLGVYAFDGTQAVSLIHEPNIGWRTSLTVMQTGELYVSGSSGADMGDDYMVRLAADGCSTEVVFYYAYTGDLYQGIYEDSVSTLSYDDFSALIGGYQELSVVWQTLCEAPMTCYEAYDLILDEYRAAAKAYSDGDYDKTLYPHTVNYAMAGSHGLKTVDFFYGYCDIDGNGTTELIIAYQICEQGMPLWKIEPLNVYTFDGKQAIQLFQDPNLGGSSSLVITEWHQIYLFQEGKETLLQIASDGYSPEVVYSYNLRTDGNQTIYYNDTEELTDMDFYWKWGPYYNTGYIVDHTTWMYFASR